jgi:pimeloyl-ACP methyl ester carboxylesterase
MKRKNLFLRYCVISLILFIYGCTNEPDNVAISSDGVKISFDKQGDGEPTLVFIHGWSNNRSIWDAQISHFSEKYKVITVDLPGFGESGNNRQSWSIVSFGNDVAAVINKLDLEQVVLVGFSMGGPVAIETANTVSERVAGIVLVDNLQNVEMKYPPPVVSYIDSVYMDLVTNPTNDKLFSGGFYKRNPDTSFQRILAVLKDAPTIGWRESLNDLLRWSNEDMAASLQKCQVPIIAINSDMHPTNVEAFRKHVPSFRAKIVPDVGHLIMWDAPEEFNHLLEESIQEFINESKLE